jgi:DNA-binding IclR family transcriptional regulator
VNDTHTSAAPEAPKSVLERVFALLDCFTAEEPTLTLAQLAAHTGIPRSTVHRLANVLVERRLLERTESGFRLGLRQFELGELVEDRRKLRDASLPSIQELFEQTHETVHLGVMDGLDVLYFVKVVGYHTFPLPTRTGGRWPMHSSALGKALLAYAPPATIEAVLASDMRRLTRHTITQPRRLQSQLQVVRDTGTAFEFEESVLGNSCVAAPIFDTSGQVLAAVSVSGPTLRLRAEQRAPIVRRAATQISRQIRQVH